MRIILALFLATFLAACNGTSNTGGGDGQRIFFIGAEDEGTIQFRHLDAVNEIRRASGLNPLELNAELIAAARTHAYDMARQNRPWHFGSDGSSPIDRVSRTGYQGFLLGENISETYEDDFLTLQAWMAESEARASILNPEARYLGLSWFQEATGKIWWVQITGT